MNIPFSLATYNNYRKLNNIPGYLINVLKVGVM